MKEFLDYMRLLQANNDREWFHAHPKEWKRAQGQYQALAAELIEGIGAFDPSVRGLQVKDCTYRIARDTRFSPDKSPYKSWLGIYVAPRGKKSGFAGYYFHVETGSEDRPWGCMLTAGIYCPEPFILKSVREEILDNGAEIERTIAASGFTLDRSNSLKRTPQGFPADSPYDEMLRLKDLYITRPISEEFILSPDVAAKAVAEFRRTQPFVEIVNRAVQYAYEEMK